MFCRNSISRIEEEQYKIFQKGEEILKEKTDIVALMKTINDLNEIKYILFNSFQAMCFNFIRKPTLSESGSNDNFSRFFRKIKNDEVTQKKEIVNYFINEFRNPLSSPYNKAFLDAIDDDIKLVIDIISQKN